MLYKLVLVVSHDNIYIYMLSLHKELTILVMPNNQVKILSLMVVCSGMADCSTEGGQFSDGHGFLVTEKRPSIWHFGHILWQQLLRHMCHVVVFSIFRTLGQ